MNPRTRQARTIIRRRTATTRANRRIHHHGHATLTTHCIAAGLPVRQARTVAATLRNHAHLLDITGHEVDMRIKWRTHSRRTGLVAARLYTPAEVAAMAVHYRPRKAAYITARRHLLTLAA